MVGPPVDEAVGGVSGQRIPCSTIAASRSKPRRMSAGST